MYIARNQTGNVHKVERKVNLGWSMIKSNGNTSVPIIWLDTRRP